SARSWPGWASPTRTRCRARPGRRRPPRQAVRRRGIWGPAPGPLDWTRRPPGRMPDQALTAMSEDDSSSVSDQPEKTPERRRSWLERLSSAISGEPSTRDDLIELLRDVQSDGLIEADTLRM